MGIASDFVLIVVAGLLGGLFARAILTRRPCSDCQRIRLEWHRLDRVTVEVTFVNLLKGSKER